MHIFGLLSIETFVLIASLLLFAYVKKNSLGKWFQIGSVAIVIFMLVMMVGTCFTACMMHCGHGGCGGGKYKHHMMMKRCGGDGGSCPMMKSDCCSGDKGCSESGSCGSGGCCDGMSGATGGFMHGGMEDMMMDMDVEVDENGDTIKKKIIIKTN